jgi:hypothetical protein
MFREEERQWILQSLRLHREGECFLPEAGIADYFNPNGAVATLRATSLLATNPESTGNHPAP